MYQTIITIKMDGVFNCFDDVIKTLDEKQLIKELIEKLQERQVSLSYITSKNARDFLDPLATISEVGLIM